MKFNYNASKYNQIMFTVTGFNDVHRTIVIAEARIAARDDGN